MSSATELAFEYGYDALGRIESVAESGHTTRTVGYSYDSAGRLYQVTHNSGADGGVVVDEEYTYSGTGSTGGPNGNRTAWTVGGVNYTATYDAQDRLSTMTPAGGATTTFAYDAHGNMTSRSDGTTTIGYTWDPRGAFTQVTRTGAQTVDYVLDPLGRRIGRKVAGALKRGWLYQGIHPVAELGTNGSTIERVFVYATRGHSPDLVLQSTSTGWVTYRVLSDHLGSVRAVIRASNGAVMQRMDYDAFGRLIVDTIATGWTPIPFGYAGGLYERNTGLVRFGAREYDPSIGRWLSRDPSGFGGGDTNIYAYCASDPSNFIDPEGRVAVVVVAVAAAGAFAAGWAISHLGASGASAREAARGSAVDSYLRRYLPGGRGIASPGEVASAQNSLQSHRNDTEADLRDINGRARVRAEHYLSTRDWTENTSGGRFTGALYGAMFQDGWEVYKKPLEWLGLRTGDTPTSPVDFDVIVWSVQGWRDGLRDLRAR